MYVELLNLKLNEIILNTKPHSVGFYALTNTDINVN